MRCDYEANLRSALLVAELLLLAAALLLMPSMAPATTIVTSKLLAFSPDGSLLAVSDPSRRIFTLRDGHTGATVREFDGDDGKNCLPLRRRCVFRQLIWTPDGRRVITSDEAGLLTMWDVTTAEVVEHFNENMRFGIASIALSPDGRRLAACDGNSRDLLLWDLAGGAELRRLTGNCYRGNAVFIDSDRLASVTLFAVTIHDLRQDGEAFEIPVIHKPKNWQAVCPTLRLHWLPKRGQLAVLNHDNGSISHWDVKERRRAATLDFTMWSAFNYSPNERFVVVGHGRILSFYDLASRLVATVKFKREIYQVLFSPDSLRLATFEQGVGLRIYTVRELLDRSLPAIELPTFIGPK